jgi:hypothetical protein
VQCIAFGSCNGTAHFELLYTHHSAAAADYVSERYTSEYANSTRNVHLVKGVLTLLAAAHVHLASSISTAANHTLMPIIGRITCVQSKVLSGLYLT